MFDAVILGGGLAGCSAGISLARKGWRVLIAEKYAETKKVCGEFLSPSIWPVLRELGISEKILSLGGSQIHSASFSGSGNLKAETKLPSQDEDFSFGYGISRKVLDACLLEEARAAGCEIACPVQAEPQEFAGQTKVLIDARGRSNVISRSVGKVGFKAHFQGPGTGDQIRLFFFPGGYFGIVQVEKEQINLCGVADKHCIKKHHADFDSLLGDVAERNPEFRRWYQSVSRTTDWLTCASLVHGKHSDRRDSIFYAGDSAYFLEPFMGQGMTMAMAGGLLLAQTLGTTPPPLSEIPFLQEQYQSRLRRLYKSRLSIGNVFQRLAMSGFQSSFLIGFLASFPPLFRFGIKKSSELAHAV